MTPSSLIIASSYLLPRFEGGTRTSISNYIILGRPPVQITSLFLASWSLFLPFIRGNRSENKNKQKEIGSGGVIVSYASLCSRSPGQSIRLQLICDFARSHGLEHLIAQQARVPACLTRRTPLLLSLTCYEVRSSETNLCPAIHAQSQSTPSLS